MTGGPVVVVDDHALVAGALAMALRSGGLDATAVLPAAAATCSAA